MYPNDMYNCGESADLHFLYFNARSLFPNLDELHTQISTGSPRPDVIAISETWCSPQEADSLYGIKGYTVYRSDRQTQTGGGVMIFASDSLNHELIAQTSTPDLESIGTATVCCAYQPPRGDYVSGCLQLEKTLQSVLHKSIKFLCVGDFNAHHQQWLSSDLTDKA